jgi:hypothetical protein
MFENKPFFFLSFWSDLFLSTLRRCGVLLVHLITLNDTHTLGRTHLDEGSAHRRDIYLHNKLRSQQTDIYALPAGFEPAVPASDWPQTHALDRAAF